MTAQELVNRTRNSARVSDAALRLINLLEQPVLAECEVVRAIESDPILASRLLRACHPPDFELKEPVSTVDQAVSLLGSQPILRLALALAFGQALVVPLPGYAMEANELWRHSLVTAAAAETVAGNISDLPARPGVPFAVGLLHDIGKLVLSQALTPEVQADLRYRVERGHHPRSEAEKEVLGTDHAEAGACLLQNWRVPEEIVEAVANHHQPVLEPCPRLSAATHLADYVAHLTGSAPGWDADAIRIDPRVNRTFNLTGNRLENIMISVRESFNRVDRLMTVG